MPFLWNKRGRATSRRATGPLDRRVGGDDDSEPSSELIIIYKLFVNIHIHLTSPAHRARPRRCAFVTTVRAGYG